MNQFLRELPELGAGLFFARVSGDSVNAGQNPDDVAVEDGRGLIEGDAANRAGRVASDAGEGENVVESFWKSAAVFRDDSLRGFLQVADAGVIAEAFPEFVNLCRACFRQGFDIGQFAQPAFPIRDNCFDLRLLEHDFGNPDGVRIMRAPPRQIAGAGIKPSQQERDESLDVRDLTCGHSDGATKYTKHMKSERRKMTAAAERQRNGCQGNEDTG